LKTISSIANEEAQALYVKQPYSDILKNLRSQWNFNKSPLRPGHGVIEGSTSHANWDVCQDLLLTYNYLLKNIFNFFYIVMYFFAGISLNG